MEVTSPTRISVGASPNKFQSSQTAPNFAGMIFLDKRRMNSII